MNALTVTKPLLSHREGLVAQMVIDGLESKEIALKLGISVKTVGVFRHNVRLKLAKAGAEDKPLWAMLQDAGMTKSAPAEKSDDSKPDYDRLIDCAAIKMPDGRVWTGKRHHHCFATIMQATGKPARSFGMCIQGFITMSGRFLDREEAYELVMETGQVKPSRNGELYSEDLYLPFQSTETKHENQSINGDWNQSSEETQPHLDRGQATCGGWLHSRHKV